LLQTASPNAVMEVGSYKVRMKCSLSMFQTARNGLMCFSMRPDLLGAPAVSNCRTLLKAN